MGVFFRALFGNRTAETAETDGQRIFFTQRVVFGGLHPNEDSTIIFVNKDKGIRRVIVDRQGFIIDFPGTECGDILPRIQYRTSIETARDGRFYMLWEVKPDGRFWGDESGFGMENEKEMMLYAFIDDEGRFESKFKIYERGSDHRI